MVWICSHVNTHTELAIENVRIKRVEFRENVIAFYLRDQANCLNNEVSVP